MIDTRTSDESTPENEFDESIVSSGQQTVSRYVSEDVPTVNPSATLREVAERMRSADVSLVVVDDGTLIHGVVSERDFVTAVALGLDLDDTPVKAIDTENLKWAAASSSVDDVAEEMLENYLRHILVGDDDGSLIGVVSMRDLLGAYLV